MTTWDKLKEHLDESRLGRLVQYGGASELEETIRFICQKIDELQPSNKSDE